MTTLLVLKQLKDEIDKHITDKKSSRTLRELEDLFLIRQTIRHKICNYESGLKKDQDGVMQILEEK